jgi:L-iditol 2-dehydrogenase
MGHEASGIVAAVGRGVHGVREGDAVACVPTVPCGACRSCRRGRENLCPHGVAHMNFGAFAEYLRLPAHITTGGTFLRPPGMTADQAAALEPLACVVRGARRLDLAHAEHVVIIGDGPIALLFLQVARLATRARILVAGHHAQRLDVARALGADATVMGDGDALREATLTFTHGLNADVVVECVGSPESWQTAPALAAPAGTVLMFGGRAEGAVASVDAYRIHYDEVDVIGAFHYGRADVRDALGLLAGPDVRIAPLITHRVPLGRFREALDLALSRRALKVAVEPDPA